MRQTDIYVTRRSCDFCEHVSASTYDKKKPKARAIYLPHDGAKTVQFCQHDRQHCNTVHNTSAVDASITALQIAAFFSADVADADADVADATAGAVAATDAVAITIVITKELSDGGAKLHF